VCLKRTVFFLPADNVLNHSMGLDRKSYSALKQINKSNIKRLVPIWSISLMNDWGELSAPAVYNGVIYAINGKCGRRSVRPSGFRSSFQSMRNLLSRVGRCAELGRTRLKGSLLSP
jgi:hypothetical protein